MVEPRHVVPGHAAPAPGHAGRERVEIPRRRAPGEERQQHAHEGPAAPVAQVGVVEVDVRECRERPASAEGAREIAERVRGRDRDEGAARRQLDDRRLFERGPSLFVREIRRPDGAGRAVRVPELRARLGDVRVRVPAAAAEERRSEAELTQPRSLGAHPLSGRSSGRSRMIRRRPVRVLAERPEPRHGACSLQPGLLVLSRNPVGRTDERRNPEAPGRRL